MKNKQYTISELKKLMEEAGSMIDLDQPEEVEAIEDAWSGGENLSQAIDMSKAGGSEEVTSSPETLSITDDRGVFRMSEGRLRFLVRNIIKKQ